MLVSLPAKKLALTDGKEVLQRLFDFTRKPGARGILSAELHARFGLQDTAGQMTLPETPKVRQDHLNKRVFLPLLSEASLVTDLLSKKV
jgi:hypothetical protein